MKIKITRTVWGNYKAKQGVRVIRDSSDLWSLVDDIMRLFPGVEFTGPYLKQIGEIQAQFKESEKEARQASADLLAWQLEQ